MEAAAEIRIAKTPADIEGVRELFLEYGRSLGFHICFQTFEVEIAGLPGGYGPPSGVLLIAAVNEDPAGCIALREIGSGVAEMKRLYVRPEHRGRSLGRQLIEELIARARQLGYRLLRLDTLPAEMQAAVALYRSFGFQAIDPYYRDPIPGALCMELDLHRPATIHST